MKFSEAYKEEVLGKVTFRVRKCLQYSIEKIEKESMLNGDFTSIEDFIRRMLKANLDIHAFTVIGDYLPMEFPGNGDATMLRAVLALMGYDPDYSAAPDIEVYPLSHWDDPADWYNPGDWDDPEDLPFN